MVVARKLRVLVATNELRVLVATNQLSPNHIKEEKKGGKEKRSRRVR